MTPGKAIFVINVAAIAIIWLLAKYSDNKQGENSMSADLPIIFIGVLTVIIDLVFAAIRIGEWLFK